MGLGKMLKGLAEKMTSIGQVSGSAFPVGTMIHFSEADGEAAMRFTLPNKTEYIVTHDKVKSATVLAMGVIDIQSNGNKGTTSIYGTKYKVELIDGKIAILTVGLGSTLYRIEHILF